MAFFSLSYLLSLVLFFLLFPPPSSSHSSPHSFVYLLACLFVRSRNSSFSCSTFDFDFGLELDSCLQYTTCQFFFFFLYSSLPIITRAFLTFIQPRFLKGLHLIQVPTVSTYTTQHSQTRSRAQAKAEAEGIWMDIRGLR